MAKITWLIVWIMFKLDDREVDLVEIEVSMCSQWKKIWQNFLDKRTTKKNYRHITVSIIYQLCSWSVQIRCSFSILAPDLVLALKVVLVVASIIPLVSALFHIDFLSDSKYFARYLNILVCTIYLKAVFEWDLVWCQLMIIKGNFFRALESFNIPQPARLARRTDI